MLSTDLPFAMWFGEAMLPRTQPYHITKVMEIKPKETLVVGFLGHTPVGKHMERHIHMARIGS